MTSPVFANRQPCYIIASHGFGQTDGRTDVLSFYIYRQAWASSLRSEYHSCGQYVSIDKIRSISNVQPENIGSPK